MKEPTAKTWGTATILTFLFSLAVDFFLGNGFTWHQSFKALEYSVAFATVTWLIALARWHRAISRF